MLRTVSFVECLVYRIRKNFTQAPGVEGIETFAQGLGDNLTPIEQNWQDIGPVEVHLSWLIVIRGSVKKFWAWLPSARLLGEKVLLALATIFY